MNEKVCPVILSGGAGTRLWPMSRLLYPKQFLPLVSDLTLLQETVQRVQDGVQYEPPLVVCNGEHRFVVAEQLREIGAAARAIVVEPEGRNTAPAIACAALLLERDDPGAVLLVLPSDHMVRDRTAFAQAVATARAAADNGAFVTFGITPDRPETGYGYIKQERPLGGVDGCYSVARFIEKPDRDTAESFLRSGDYTWNSGMFVLPAGPYLAELERLHPDLLAACREALDGAVADPDFLRLGAQAFARAPSISIDYAVMEKTSHAAVVPVEMGWTDVGSWTALWQIGEKDAEGNLLIGDVLAEGVRNSYIRTDGQLTAVLGVEDLVLVVTDDVVLAADRNQVQDVKELVQRLADAGRDEVVSHAKVYRPWGHYESIDAGDRYQVKRITVKPGAKLSLQLHHKRAEHWVVVNGTARVTRGEDVFDLAVNESTYIPVETAHRLENPGDQPLSLIEVQSGSYLGEDDIERLEDDYGRHTDDK